MTAADIQERSLIKHINYYRRAMQVYIQSKLMLSMHAYNYYTVLLEYFAGEKPLQLSQISRKVDPLRSNYCIWQGSCVFTSNNLGFADFIVAN